MWTLQKLMWIAFWRKEKWSQLGNLCAFVKNNRRRKCKKCNLDPVKQQYFEAVAGSGSPAVKEFWLKDCQDVTLIAPNDTDYLVRIKKIISEFQAKRPKDYVPRPPSNLYLASKMTECVVRACYGWDFARIIRYAQGHSPSHAYLECDLLRSDTARATVFVGEVKSYAANKPSATMQLRKRCEALATRFEHVIPIVFSVKMSSMKKTQDLLHPIARAVKRKGFLYLHIALTLKDVLDYAAETRMHYDEKIISDAYAEAQQSITNYVKKQIKKN
ncbi:MAG: hypothetical protein LBT49_05010 [Prevotellaceae bacterium]|jgi:hypothetical protein|nr:hypothetical protein [Prevotellaceae bacterium]